jgi:alkyl sulfatase BDS1-like metallo-beta-lactamase superfamily hydrolase
MTRLSLAVLVALCISLAGCDKTVTHEPGADAQAKGLLANTYDQLGYQSESGPWRDVYLSGAYELRHGVDTKSGIDTANALGLLKETPLPRFFDAMAAMLNGPDAEGVDMAINLIFSDIDESYTLDIENAVLHHRPAKADTDASIILTQELFLRMLTGQAGLRETIMGDDLNVEGSKLDLLKFFSLFEPSMKAFNIVTP